MSKLIEVRSMRIFFQTAIDARVLQTVKVCLFNQWVIATPLFVLSYYVKKYTNTIPPVDELPTFTRFFVDMFIMTVIDEFGLYYVHRYATV